MDESSAHRGDRGLRLEQPIAAGPWDVPGAEPEVALFGEWNTANLGDRAIHREALRFFAECGWRTSSYSLGSLAPADAYEAGARVLPAASGLKRIALDRVPRVKRAMREARQRHRMQRLLPRLARVQTISVGGGAVLSDVNLHFPQSLAMLTEAARLLDKPLLCLGCSAEGPWSAQGEEKIREFLGACKVVAARDKATAARIASVLCRPVPLFGDFCLREVRMGNDGGWQHARHGLAINVCEISAPWRAAQQRYEDALVALADRFARGTANRGPQAIRIFTTGTPDDANAARRVFARLAGENAKLHLPDSLDELTAVLRGSAMVIASRLHGAILALSEQAPVIGFSPAPKLGNFFSTMDLGEYSFTVEDSARLMRWLERTDYESVPVAQRRALLHAPAWAGRSQVREALASIAGALPRAGIDVIDSHSSAGTSCHPRTRHLTTAAISGDSTAVTRSLDATRRERIHIAIYLKHFPATGAPLIGGTSVAVDGLATGLVQNGADVTVLCEGAVRSTVTAAAGYTIECFLNRKPYRTFSLAPELQRYAGERLTRSNGLCLVNGIFHPAASAMGRLLYRLGVPYVAVPHDAYDPAIFRKNAHLKWPYWYLIERRLLRRARAVQVLDARYASCLRRLGVNTPCFETPNGVMPDAVPAESELGWRAGTPVRLMFLGRIDAYHKGLDLLLPAFARVRREPDMRLTIQGPDWGDRGQLEKQAAAAMLTDHVEFRAPEYGRSARIIAEHDIFCLPSRFEGFGLAALEAMLAGRVLLVSESAGIAQHVRASRCGVTVPPTVDGIEQGLHALLRLRPSWREMGLSGRRYALANLQWKSIGAAALERYAQLLA